VPGACWHHQLTFSPSSLLLLLACFTSWLRQQPLFHNMQQLLRGVPEPSVLDTYLTVLGSPLLQLRVLQYKIWKVRHQATASSCTCTVCGTSRVCKQTAPLMTYF
jgi:hypothetical protein